MLSHKTGWLALGIILFSLSGWTGGVAESQSSKKDLEAAQLKKTLAKIKGFRSARFGMSKEQVLRAIAKDFNITRDKVLQSTHLTEKTTSLMVTIPNLLAVGGTASIGYILGYQSGKLMQVNVVWGKGASNNVNPQGVIDVSNLLRSHLVKRHYKKNGYMVNGRLDAETIIVFRGRDEKDRMVLLLLTKPKAKKGASKKEAAKNISLKLSYMLDPEKADVFKAKAK